jgi:hypothetical protein
MEGGTVQTPPWQQLLESLRQKSLLPRLRNDRVICLLGRLFRLVFRGFCLASVTPVPHAGSWLFCEDKTCNTLKNKDGILKTALKIPSAS